MSSTWLPILEGLLVAALVFGFGFWELHKLKKERRHRAAEKTAEDKD